MADQKISELTALTGANVADDDAIAIVDTSATETKKIVFSELKNALDTATGFVRITGDTMTGDLSMGDNVKAIFGAGSDLSVYHDGTRSHIEEAGLGGLWISTNGTEIKLKQGGGVDEEMLVATPNGSVDLYYNNNLKLATTSTGINVTGDATFADNGKAIFGAGSDLQIYHDGSASYIQDTGTGALYLQGDGGVNIRNAAGTENKAVFASDGAVTLYHDNAAKFATTSTGIDVTGDITTDGMTTSAVIKAPDGSAAAPAYTNSGDADGGMYFPAANQVSFASGGLERLNIGSGGDISFYDSLGSSQSFFWDASTERLGLGTTTPQGDLSISDGGAQGLEINANTSGDTRLFVYNRSTNAEAPMQIRASEVDFSLGGANRMVVSTTGIDVTGSISADGLTVSQENPKITITDTGTGADHELNGASSIGNLTLNFDKNDDGSSPYFYIQHAGSKLAAFRKGGDISFYEDTGTTAKFFWDASAESLGIGTASPSEELDISADAPSMQLSSTNASGRNYGLQSTNNGKFAFYDGTAGVNRMVIGSSGVVDIKNVGSEASPSLIFGGDDDTGLFKPTSNTLAFSTFGSEAMRIDSSGNVMVGGTVKGNAGTVSLNVGNVGSTIGGLQLWGTTTGTHYVQFGDESGTAANHYRGYMAYSHNEDSLRFGTASTERMRISSDGSCRWTPDGTIQDMTLDASGNLLVGKTVNNTFNEGFVAKAAGGANVTSNGATALDLNRRTSDGDIAVFRKDNAPVGSIGVNSNIYLAGTSSGLRVRANDIIPATSTGAGNDNALDLGISTARWDDIYATNGTIQTSDRNEKQDIAELSDAEQRVAVAAKGLLRKFRWKDAVAEKGDEARTHFGIIAQDLQAAFAAEGLDAGDYAMFISSTWTDEETGEEKTRMGVRYSELLAFIIAAI